MRAYRLWVASPGLQIDYGHGYQKAQPLVHQTDDVVHRWVELQLFWSAQVPWLWAAEQLQMAAGENL